MSLYDLTVSQTFDSKVGEFNCQKFSDLTVKKTFNFKN